MQNRTKILAAYAFLVSAAQSFSSELASLIGSTTGTTGINLKRHTVYVRKNATNASSNWHVVDENTTKIEGVSSFSKTSLPKNQGVVFDKIAVGFAEGDAEGREGALDYTSTKAPAVLRNAVLQIRQNNREVIEIPMADLVKTISPGSPEDYYHDLEGFNYLVDDQPMEWVVKFPQGETLAPSAAGKFNYLEIRLQGFKTSRKV